jgi:hypothetical protein
MRAQIDINSGQIWDGGGKTPAAEEGSGRRRSCWSKRQEGLYFITTNVRSEDDDKEEVGEDPGYDEVDDSSL